jgi:hypothetical protein
LEGLINDVFKTDEMRQLFEQWGDGNSLHSGVNYDKMIELLGPWIEGEPTRPLSVPRPKESPLNCSAQRFSHALAGGPAVGKNYVVDFVPFGYDMDKLEVRLLEGFPYVDLFVIYESPLTHTGFPKPRYFDHVRNSDRFKGFADKILYVHSEVADLAHHVPAPGSPRAKYWKLERSMRWEMVRLFGNWVIEQHAIAMDTGTAAGTAATRGFASEIKAPTNTTAHHDLSQKQWHDIVARVLVARDPDVRTSKIDMRSVRVLGVQNDGDEIMVARTLQHLTQCRLLNHLQFPLYAPAFAFKKNFHWLQKGGGVGEECLEGADQPKLKRFLWGAGPRLWPLEAMLFRKNTLRHVGRPVQGDKQRHVHCTNHLGLGAAFHITAVAEPAEEWMKVFSVVDSFALHGHDLLDVRLRKSIAGKADALPLSAELIFNVSSKPWCGHGAKHQAENHVMVNTDAGYDAENVFSEQELAVVREVIPWSVRLNPDRYPFLLPGESTTSGPYRNTETLQWVNHCVR